ncbi:xanthine dehydrogenase-like [Haliotis rubra]|uniref:xanthine dehydrogenase-like n=1 Tax=Haliotis rubra TaxID=36100 RepID=UPI001EE5D272|nr:xanthine dehydrogenase-like [Haliotis rubra]
MERQGVLVTPRAEHNEVDLYCTAQDPSSAQNSVAEVLGIPLNRVVCHVKRLGGAFGGRETRINLLCQPVAVAAYKYRRPVRCVLDRRTDMTISGKGPRFHAKYKVGYTKDGRIQSVAMDVYVDAGHSADIAFGVLQLSVLNFESAYRYPNCRITGYLCKTNTPPNTALRGFGLPDSFLVSEVGYTKDGRIQSVAMDMYVDAGHSADIAFGVLQLSVLNFESAYRYPNCRITGLPV